MAKWNESETVVSMKFGSHVYGTNLPTSDQDYKGVFLPSARSLILGSAPHHVGHSTGAEGEKNSAEDVDTELFSIHQYLKHLCNGQTVAVDMLFVPDEFLSVKSDTWVNIQFNRSVLISKNVAAFVGYCRTQANKYGIKGSRMNAARGARDKFASIISDARNVTMHRVGDYAKTMESLAAQFEHIEILELGAGNVPHLSVCGKKIPYTLKVFRAYDMMDDLFQRYGERARQAESNENIDWKATMHAVRVLEQAKELLSTGHITFPRPEAYTLLKIRNGEVPFKRVSELITDGIEELEACVEKSTLPEKPDRHAADSIILEAYEDALA